MAHQTIGNKTVVDWTTGDPEGDRKVLMSAYRDFIKEIQKVISESDNMSAVDVAFDKWSIDTENQIDEFPRIWIKRPEK